MSLLWNRIGLSLLIILVAIYFWEFWIKPVSGPIYTAAVTEYKQEHYKNSLDLLNHAYQIDPNDTAILTLMGWDELKLNHPREAESNFERAHRLAPAGADATLGYVYAEIQLKQYEMAASLLDLLRRQGVSNADVHLAWGTLYRESGKNLEAAREFKTALDLRPNDPLAMKNLQELYNAKDEADIGNLQFRPFVRPAQLTYTSRVEGNHFTRLSGGAWKPVYWTGVDLNAALPGEFPVESQRDPDIYKDWLGKIGNLGVNTVRITTLLPPAFYRALYEYDSDTSHAPLWLLQGITFPAPLESDDLFNGAYYASCVKEITDTVDAVQGEGDVESNHLHSGGLYPNDVAPWVAGFVVGNTWLSHVVNDNNQLHPEMQSFNGSYAQIPSGSPTEIFLGQMIDYLEQYEAGKYNWEHPAAFLNWPTLDPMHHPTESTMVEEMAIRHRLGERFMTTPGPYDDDDSVTVDPLHLHATAKFPAGYFADYSVFPFYPDFMNYDPGYQAVQDSAGSDPFLGYLQDLKTHTSGLPLVISDYGIPTSLGIGHFSPAGFNEGGKTEEQQGTLLARFTRNIYDAGAGGGMVFEWMDEWFRRSWLTRDFETPEEDKPLWANFLDPAEYYGILAADPHKVAVHRLEGDENSWANLPALYSKSTDRPYQPAGDRWDTARNLKALYVDSDEGFLYLRLVVNKLDPDNTGHADWSKVNYLIGIGTNPGNAGIRYLPFIAPVRFPDGMTYAIQIAGPESSHIWIASSYDPYRIVSIEGMSSETLLSEKLGWKPQLTDLGTFEGQIIEPNRRRFGRDGKYFPPERYDRGILRYGTLDPASPDFDPLAEWHASVSTNTIDIRIPWALLNVTDPSKLQIFAGLERDGTVETQETPGFEIVAFSYRPLEAAGVRPIMEQGHPIADSLPPLSGPASILEGVIREYRWAKWNKPQYALRMKESYDILRKAFLALPSSPPASGEKAAMRTARKKP